MWGQLNRMEKKSGQKEQMSRNEWNWVKFRTSDENQEQMKANEEKSKENSMQLFFFITCWSVSTSPDVLVILLYFVFYCVSLCFIVFHWVALCFIVFHCVLVILHCIVFHCVWDGFQFEYFHSPHPHALALCTKIKGNLEFYPLRKLLALKVNINWT